MSLFELLFTNLLITQVIYISGIFGFEKAYILEENNINSCNTYRRVDLERVYNYTCEGNITYTTGFRRTCIIHADTQQYPVFFFNQEMNTCTICTQAEFIFKPGKLII